MSLVEKQAANQMQIVMEHDDTTLVDGHYILLDTFFACTSWSCFSKLLKEVLLYITYGP
jgi:hypothetical protein